MKKSLSMLAALFFSMNLSAQVVVDVYGEDDKRSEVIIKKYAKAVSTIETAIMSKFSEQVDHPELIKIEKLTKKKKALIEQIKKEGGYLFVNFDTVMYPGNKQLFTTIEVIKQNDPNRLRFVDSTANHQDKPIKHKPDLIDEMTRFSRLTISIGMNRKPGDKPELCPVYHCIGGFSHPQLKPYLSRFNTGVIKEKKLILETLKNDPSIERRESAIFLIGHLRDPHEIISLLTPYITDKDSAIRNNAMRVIGTTLLKSHILEMDVTPLLALLDSPYDTDRNKSLWILYSLVDSEANKRSVINKGGNQLIELLKLKQINNHEIAYLVLKKVSGKDFGEYNIAGWKNWLNTYART